MVYDKSLQCLKLTQMSRIRNLDVSEGGGRKTPGITRNFNIFSKKLHFISSDIFILRIKQERAESEMVTQKMPRIAHPYIHSYGNSGFTRITHETSKVCFHWGSLDIKFYVVSEGPACPGIDPRTSRLQGESVDHYAIETVLLRLVICIIR